MTAIWLLLAVFAAPPPPQTDPGARAFQRCAACHSLRSNEESAPRLGDVLGRRAGAVRSFAYSDAMEAAGQRGLVWDAATLERFLADPDAVVPGTTMPYQGGSAAERRALIDWLRRSSEASRNRL
ncbi:c-type cytochrome [Brevundimonas sp. BR2-1]|uniref:c-type cytochrome n=1 Tax=unclassified Brevundimonas TaxID=2622653 RepID=UPI002FC8C013